MGVRRLLCGHQKVEQQPVVFRFERQALFQELFQLAHAELMKQDPLELRLRRHIGRMIAEDGAVDGLGFFESRRFQERIPISLPDGEIARNQLCPAAVKVGRRLGIATRFGQLDRQRESIGILRKLFEVTIHEHSSPRQIAPGDGGLDARQRDRIRPPAVGP